MANPTVFKSCRVCCYMAFVFIVVAVLLPLLVLQLHMMLLHDIKLCLFFDRHFLEAVHC